MPRNRDTGKHLMFDVFSNTEAVPWERVTWFKCMELVLPALDHGCWAAMSAVSRYKRSISPPTPPPRCTNTLPYALDPGLRKPFIPPRVIRLKGQKKKIKWMASVMGWIVSAPNPYVEVLTRPVPQNVPVSGDRFFEEASRVKWGHTVSPNPMCLGPDLLFL